MMSLINFAAAKLYGYWLDMSSHLMHLIHKIMSFDIIFDKKIMYKKPH